MNNEDRLTQVEGQIQALAQAWLRLAAVSEEAGNHDPERLEKELLSIHWHGHAFEPAGQQLLEQMVRTLAEARSCRKLG